jgi:hypothetical protein
MRTQIRTLQMPGNMLELGGVHSAAAIAEQGVRVMLTRPLTLMTPEGALLSVADVDAKVPPRDYMEVCR